MKNTNSLSEHDIRLFLDAADRLFLAAEQQGKTAERATLDLLNTVTVHKRQMHEIRDDVISAVTSIAGSTAQKSANLLADHFREADSAAEDAKARYEKACRSLGWRNWLWFLAAQGVLCTVAIVLIATLVPSLDEIHARRAALAQLQEETKGVPLSWTDCFAADGKVYRCFRTDEQKGAYTSKDGSTWHVPWRKP
ncbi:hypothetical protein IFU33_22805 (plasmid) [Pantoea agglomerans]|uniref:hypothetical protein n=1 Tax=Enterobacter agglomerans TaxID=549 RepID=UPI001781E434|nr:hypothetical protein [Pantoea agglomerans]WLO87346.1 hypothetical protein NHB29_23110 [Pantoea agglomerans]WVJ49103.1 hypothetical protein IFU33_22805 [Pantoea agglomerans]